MAQITQKRGFWYGWIILGVVLVCYFLIVGFVGVGAYPVIMPAMRRERGWGTGDTLLASSTAAWMGIVIAPLGGWITDKLGGRIILFLASLAAAATFGLMTKITEIWQWLFLWGILRPPESRVGGTVTFFQVITRWFNLRRGLVMGLALTGGGFGGSVAAPLLTWAMQTSGAWQWGWGILAAVTLFAATLWVIFIRSNPSDIGSWPDGLTPEEAVRAREAALARTASGKHVIATTYRSPINWSLGDAMRTRAFWMTALMWIGYQGSYNTATNQGVLQLTRTGRFTPMEAAVSVSIYTIFSGTFRIFIGWVTDRIESRFVIMFGIAMGMIAIAALSATAPGNYFLMYTYAVCAGINLGTCYPSLNIQVGNYWGPANYATINSTVFATVAGIVLSFFPAGGGYIYDLTGSYQLYFMFVGVVQVIGLGACLLCTPPRPKEVATPRPAA